MQIAILQCSIFADMGWMRVKERVFVLVVEKFCHGVWMLSKSMIVHLLHGI